MSYFSCLSFTLVAILYGVINAQFAFQNGKQVQARLDNIEQLLAQFWETNGGSENAEIFANGLQMSADFEEYVAGLFIIGREEGPYPNNIWKPIAEILPAYFKSLDPTYSVKFWHPRHVSANFKYKYVFCDGTKLTASGEVVFVWNIQGELRELIYLTSDGSMGNMLDKWGELMETYPGAVGCVCPDGDDDGGEDSSSSSDDALQFAAKKKGSLGRLGNLEKENDKESVANEYQMSFGRGTGINLIIMATIVIVSLIVCGLWTEKKD